MPTLEHNAIVEMFRENPQLAPHVLSTIFHRDVPSHASVRVANSALDQLIPVEFRADLVLELIDEGEATLAIVLEVQRERSSRKRFTWAVYWTVARAERECPAVVLVVAPDADVATWAGEKIDLGLGLGTIQPLVLGPGTLPVLTDPTVATNEVELAVLSAMAHGNGPKGLAVVQAALLALGRLDREHEAVYFQSIWYVLREPVRRALEALAMERQIEGKATLPPFAQKLIERGIREGELKGLRDALLRLVVRAGLTLSENDRARIQACEDTATLDRWIESVLGAKTAADVLS